MGSADMNDTDWKLTNLDAKWPDEGDQMWKRDFPYDAREMWDVLAKALMLRAGGNVTISHDELRCAATVQAEINLRADSSIEFRVERN